MSGCKHTWSLWCGVPQITDVLVRRCLECGATEIRVLPPDVRPRDVRDRDDD